MSKETVKQMFGKIEKDAQLQKKYAELMRLHQAETEKAMAEKLIEFGKTAGLAFSNEDLMAARAELIDNANSNHELSNSDLASVAGGNANGKTGFVLASVFTLGIGCVAEGIKSLVNDSYDKGSCAASLSLTADCWNDRSANE